MIRISTSWASLAWGYEVTEQHQINEALVASESNFRILLESLPNMAWTHLPDGTGNFFSKRWSEYLGVEVGDMSTFDWSPYINPHDLEEARKLYADSIQSGQLFQHEQRIRRADGEWRWHLNRALPLYDEDGAINLWVGTSTDIHEVREAEAELTRLSEELRDTNELLRQRNRDLAQTNEALMRINADMDTFVYTASHDLKAPVTNIQGLHALLREELADRAPDVEPILNMMDQSLMRFMRTVRELADIAQLQKMEHADEQTLVHEVVEEVLLDCAPDLAVRGGTISNNTSPECKIWLSHKNARSVVYNLVSNAIKYQSPERPLHVDINCTELDNQTVLEVVDNGLGMNLAGKHRLFSMFYRMHNHVEGSGVGLHIVKRIVDKQGGEIQVESTPNVGTTFRIYLSAKPS